MIAITMRRIAFISVTNSFIVIAQIVVVFALLTISKASMSVLRVAVVTVAQMGGGEMMVASKPISHGAQRRSASTGTSYGVVACRIVEIEGYSELCTGGNHSVDR